MAGMLTELSVAARRLVDTFRRRRAGEIESAPDRRSFREGLQSLLDRAPSNVIAEYHWLDLRANAPPWVDSKLNLQQGQQATYFICGRTWASRPLDIWVSPAVQVWSRIGDGDIISATRDSHTVVADRQGTLQFGNFFPNDWADRQGNTKQPDNVYRSLKGDLRVLVIRWQADALTGLQALQKVGDHDGWLASESERLERGTVRPRGWQPLWHVPDNEIYRDCRGPNGEAAICCHTHGDVGILQRKADFLLAPDTRLDWRWNVSSLPSQVREDAVPSHDYLSIAVEFDNGLDITYYWSSTLPVGTGYICPLPAWKEKEYHLVVRSGEDGLGEWHSQSRYPYADYQQRMGRKMGDRVPRHIVRIWLIANSVFQRGTGECAYAGIRLSNSSTSLTVL